ncbi:MAG: T9SS type A sorting domain-containing protein [Ignavibacteria bacterium]|nr:T9SS type A sorting domain-containing protein [Ignavibacteria bacterium]
MRIFLILIISTIIFLPQNIFSQGGDPSLLRNGLLDGNQISVSFSNDGAVAGITSGSMRGEWPKGSGQYYVADMSFLVGVEFVNSIGDTVHSVIIPRGPRNGQNDERDPVTGKFWGFNPVPGYFDLGNNKIAQSNQPETWPAIWPDHPEYGSNVWNGLYGPNNFVGDVETFFKIDDTQDEEFNSHFLPDSSNPTMKGYGIRVFVRYIQIDHPLFRDVLFRVFDIKNEGNYHYEKVFWGNITGTISGGDGDSGDDLSEINKKKNLVYSYDWDGIGNIGQRVAYMGEGLIDSPSGNSFGSFRFFNLSSSLAMNYDEILWNFFTPGKIDTLTPIPQDGDHLYGTKYFSLYPGETKRVVMTLGFDYDYYQLEQKINFAKMLWNCNFQIDDLFTNINFNNLNFHKTLSGTTNISWTSAIQGGTIDLYYSSDLGEHWQDVATSLPNNGNYNWNTTNVPDCAFGKLRVIIFNNDGNPVGFNDSHTFTIDNPQNGEPFVKIDNIEYDTTITSEMFNLKLWLGDPENQPLNLTFHYSRDNGLTYEEFHSVNISPDTTQIYIPIQLGNLLNTSSAKIKITASDGNSTSSTTSEKFRKITERTFVTPNYINHTHGNLQLPYQIIVIDSSKLTGNEYLISFNDTSRIGEKYFSVKNLTTSQMIFSDELFYENFENREFDGLSFFAEELSTSFDSTGSGWNQNVSNNFTYAFYSYLDEFYPINNGYAMPSDYKIVFYNTVVDTSIADTLYPVSPQNILTPTPVNFKIWNTTTNQPVNFSYKKTGTVTTAQTIFIKELVKNKLMRTWRLIVRFPGINVIPTLGDTLTMKTIKGFSIFDTLKVMSIPVNINDVESIPNDYSLSQNYPNPFNPITKINYTIPQTGLVTIKVFDILGKEITTLVNEEKKSGNHKIEFNGSKLSSGIYFYQIKSGSFTATKKLVLLK